MEYVIRGSALKALEGDEAAAQSIRDLMAAVDDYMTNNFNFIIKI